MRGSELTHEGRVCYGYDCTKWADMIRSSRPDPKSHGMRWAETLPVHRITAAGAWGGGSADLSWIIITIHHGKGAHGKGAHGKGADLAAWQIVTHEFPRPSKSRRTRPAGKCARARADKPTSLYPYAWVVETVLPCRALGKSFCPHIVLRLGNWVHAKNPRYLLTGRKTCALPRCLFGGNKDSLLDTQGGRQKLKTGTR